ncbi:unnamed protein product [Lymnaea stagnalis]|uniref:Dystroglycan 1 n=1 Tax=Lymnaea stagnalis TaxID=6523 RepID=A0AAV2H4N6_LYMST
MASIPFAKTAAFLLTLVCHGVLSQREGDGAVAVKWGVADSTATVGRKFHMHIPGDAFGGQVLSYTIQSVDGSPLPAWLQFSAQDNVLQGIPTPKDAGQLYLEITASGISSQASVTFTLFIRDVPSHTSGAPLKFKSSGPEFVRCKPSEAETVATVIIDADLESLPVTGRIALLQKFVSHMQLHEDMIKMIPVGTSPMHDSSALVSGTGDCTSPKTSGSFISWPVGCGQVKDGHFPVLQRLDDDSTTGRMAKVLGHCVIGWHVTNSHIQAPARKRRQVQPTQTHAITPVMPTKTEKVAEKTDDPNETYTRKVIDMESPTMIMPTATQPPMHKTDMPTVASPDVVAKHGKVMPTEVTVKETTMDKTEELPPIKPTRTHDGGLPTDAPVAELCPKMGVLTLKENLLSLTVNIGEVFTYHIPGDLFLNCGANFTRELQLEFEPNLPDYVQFNAKNQKIMAFTLEEQKKRNFIMRGKTKSLTATVTINIHTRKRKPKKLNHEVSATVKYDFDKLKANVSDQIQLANRIAHVFGDADAHNLQFSTPKEGSVIYTWFNKTLTQNGCPVAELNANVAKLINKDGTLNEEAVERILPYELVSASAKPMGSCEGTGFHAIESKPLDDTVSVEVSTPGPTDIPPDKLDTDGDGDEVDTPVDSDDSAKKSTEKPGDVTEGSEDVVKGSKGGSESDDDDVWITTVVPAVVIVAILLIALLVACCLYRKKRKGKMNVEEQNTFINKGTPVIFPNELEEQPNEFKKPLLVDESPAPPPGYPRAASESPERNINNYRNNGNNVSSEPHEDDIIEMPDRKYEPPPPVTTSGNSKQPRPTHQPQPFSQQPQILP